MSDEKLRRLINNARVEMGPKVFRQFQNDMAGTMSKVGERLIGAAQEAAAMTTHTLVCALCRKEEDDGHKDFDCTPPNPHDL